MTKDEALQLLDQVCSQVAGSRADHAKIQEAIEVLRKATEKKSSS